MAQIQGTAITASYLSMTFDLVPKVRSVEKLGRKEVSLRPSNYCVAKVTTFKELPRGTPMSLQRNGSAGNRGVGVMASQKMYAPLGFPSAMSFRDLIT
jgi:hypothetical protein